MAFRISARTVLELGAELISSDEVALYELVKNAIDARSKSGVEINLHICFSHSAYAEVMQQLERKGFNTIHEARESLTSRAEPTAEPEILSSLNQKLASCKTLS